MPKFNTMAEFVFGDKITKTLGWIADDAIREGTEEAFEHAIWMVRGIGRLFIHWGDPGSSIALSNFENKLHRCKDDPELRAGVRERLFSSSEWYQREMRNAP